MGLAAAPGCSRRPGVHRGSRRVLDKGCQTMSGEKNRSMNRIRTQVFGKPRGQASVVSWRLHGTCVLALILALFTLPAGAQSFTVQCPTSTLWHPAAATSAQGEPAYTRPTTLTNGVPLTYVYNGGTVKCQQISGGDGYMTEADGNQTFMFSFGPLSGLGLIQQGLPGTQLASEFALPYNNPWL